MVRSSEASPYISPVDIVAGQELVVMREDTHEIVEFEREGKKTKKLVIGVEGFSQRLAVNNTTRAKLEKAWGTDTVKWPGRRIRVKPALMIIGGREVEIILGEPVEASLDRMKLQPGGKGK